MDDKNNKSKMLIAPALIYQILYRKAANLSDSKEAIKKSMIADGIDKKDMAALDAIYDAYVNSKSLRDMSIHQIIESANQNVSTPVEKTVEKPVTAKKQKKVQEDDSDDDFAEFF